MAKDKAASNLNADTPYVHDDKVATKSKFANLVKTRGFRIAAIAAGGTLALGAAFGIGLSAGHLDRGGFNQGQFGQQQEHSKFGPGQHPEGPAGHDRDRDGDHGGNFNPNGVAPTPNATTTPGAQTTNP